VGVSLPPPPHDLKELCQSTSHATQAFQKTGKFTPARNI
jgi:hypothetical protein